MINRGVKIILKMELGNLLVTTEKIAEVLEVNPNTILNWEQVFALNIKTHKLNDAQSSSELITFFKKVKSLILNGYSLEAIKEILAPDVESGTQLQNPTDGFIVEEEMVQSDQMSGGIIDLGDDCMFKLAPSAGLISKEKNALFNAAVLNNNSTQLPGNDLFETLLSELKQYADRALEAEKKLYLMQYLETRSDKKNDEVSSEIAQLKAQLELKEQKLEDYEQQQKRLNLMEVQLRLLQMEKSKKKFWEIWK